MKTGTEFNLAQIIESLSANASVPRIIPGTSVDGRQFSRFLDAAMDSASRGESGMPSSAISKSGSIMPLYADAAATAETGQADIAEVVSAEQPLQLATVNFLSGRTILITPVDVMEAGTPRELADPSVPGLPQWWQDERSPHPAQSLSGVMALVHGSPAFTRSGPEPYEWDGDFDIHSGSDREPGDPGSVADITDIDLDDAITSLMAWQELKQATAALPRESAPMALVPDARLPVTASSISYIDARRTSATTRSAEPLPAAEEAPPVNGLPGSEAAAFAARVGAGLAPTIPAETEAPHTAASPVAGVASPPQSQLQPTRVQPSQHAQQLLDVVEVAGLQRRSSGVITEGDAESTAHAAGANNPSVSQALPLDIPAAAAQPEPQLLQHKPENPAELADLAQLAGATDDPALIDVAVPRDVSVVDGEELVQQRYSQPLVVRTAESNQGQGHPAGNGGPGGHNDAPGNNRSDVAEPMRESGLAAPSIEAVAEAPATPLPLKGQTVFSGVTTMDAGVTATVVEANQSPQTLLQPAVVDRPQTARTELRQEFADTLLGFAAEQIEIPEQGAVTRLRLEVSPPELGNLEIEVTQGPDVLDIRIIASDEAAAATLRDSEHVMRELLSRNDSSRVTIGIDVSTRDSGDGRRREPESEPDTAPGKSRSRQVKIRLNNDNNFDIYV
jgi:flagellar hook-length control protein FliK